MLTSFVIFSRRYFICDNIQIFELFEELERNIKDVIYDDIKSHKKKIYSL